MTDEEMIAAGLVWERGVVPALVPRRWAAWRAAVGVLEGGDWVSRKKVLEVMAEASDIQRDTSLSVLATAVRAGVLVKDSRGRNRARLRIGRTKDQH